MLGARLVFLAVLAAFVAVGPAGDFGEGAAQAAKPARAKTQGNKVKRKVAAKRGKRARLVCTGKGAKRRCRRERGRFAGRRVVPAELRTELLPRASGHIRIVSPNVRDEAKVNIYNPDGSLNEEALAKLDRVFRCRRTEEERAVDPRLYEVLSIIYDHFGGRTIYLTSGFRFQRNEGSRHFHASAMDISVEGVSYKALYEFAQTRDLGGMGLGKYPHDGFVHIDFRAPGEESYRWTDTSRSKARAVGRRPSTMWRRPTT